MNVDVLAVGAHPDDVEAGAGGVVAKLIKNGRRVAILDLSRGELASRGSPEERAAEAAEAARILGVAERANAALPDGAIANSTEQQRVVVPHIRRFRPQAILAPMDGDRHPDHGAARSLVRDANFLSGLARIPGGEAPWRASTVFHYRVHGKADPPQLVIDITREFETKLAAMGAYASQFHNPGYNGPPTYVASPEFWESIRVRAAYWGSLIGVQYGEPLFSDGPLALDLPPGC